MVTSKDVDTILMSVADTRRTWTYGECTCVLAGYSINLLNNEFKNQNSQVPQSMRYSFGKKKTEPHWKASETSPTGICTTQQAKLQRYIYWYGSHGSMYKTTHELSILFTWSLSTVAVSVDRESTTVLWGSIMAMSESDATTVWTSHSILKQEHPVNFGELRNEHETSKLTKPPTVVGNTAKTSCRHHTKEQRGA